MVSRMGPFITQIVSQNQVKNLKARIGDHEIADDLRNYVFRRCYVRNLSMIQCIDAFYHRLLVGIRRYFSIPSLRFSPDYPKMHIFTTNFDNCVELFCRRQQVHLYDGYDKTPMGAYRFEHALYLNAINSDALKLYKIHGTVRYVRNLKGEFDELPLLPEDERIIINGEKCAPDLVYSGSYQYTSNSPQLELLYLMKQQLRVSNIILAMGYSFRDPHVLTVFKDALQENRTAKLVICSTNPKTTVCDRLSFARDRCILLRKEISKLNPETDFQHVGVPK